MRYIQHFVFSALFFYASFHIPLFPSFVLQQCMIYIYFFLLCSCLSRWRVKWAGWRCAWSTRSQGYKTPQRSSSINSQRFVRPFPPLRPLVLFVDGHILPSRCRLNRLWYSILYFIFYVVKVESVVTPDSPVFLVFCFLFFIYRVGRSVCGRSVAITFGLYYHRASGALVPALS